MTHTEIIPHLGMKKNRKKLHNLMRIFKKLFMLFAASK